MAEMKRGFLQGKMNKDLDERLIPSGQYKHAENIEIISAENSGGGTARNILGNSELATGLIPQNSFSVGCIANERTNK